MSLQTKGCLGLTEKGKFHVAAVPDRQYPECEHNPNIHNPFIPTKNPKNSPYLAEFFSNE